VDTFRFKGARHAAKIDQQVGDRIRRRRTLLGFTQEQLAGALDISYQQIQKYETGANRVSAGRLYQIAQRLEAPISYFFEGLGLDFEGEQDVSVGSGSNRATIELVRNFNQIADGSVRNAVAGLVKALSGGDSAVAMGLPVSLGSRNGDSNGSNGSNGGSPSGESN
jgi:transcriptional regulator with XRE-family HTH domain